MPDVSQLGDRLTLIREHVEEAHRHVQAAQVIAYGGPWNDLGATAPLRVRLALNKAQSVLIKLLIHRLPSRWSETPSRGRSER